MREIKTIATGSSHLFSEGFEQIPELSSREKALDWWNNLASLRKTQICDTNTEIVGCVRRWETLKGREIEKIYNLINIK